MLSIDRKIFNKFSYWSCFISAIGILILHTAFAGEIENEIYANTFSRLEQVKIQKKAQLLEFCESVRRQAGNIRSDRIMFDFFILKHRYYQLQKNTPPTEHARCAMEEYQTNILLHYAENYIQFYDLLLINPDGDIFFTIKKQADYHDNIFRGSLASSSFAAYLKSNPAEGYLDFEYYHPSDEPAAFFVEPVYDGKTLMGWFVLQWAVNKLNSLITDYENLGNTGEIFLVNQDQYTLNDARFIGDSTVLTKHLNAQNIQLKFQQRVGNLMIRDYRGFSCLTSFEVFSVMGSEWLLITKIDEDEILNEYFLRRQQSLQSQIIECLPRNYTPSPILLSSSKIKNVDMDEFRKVYPGEWAQTQGVSTCTVFIASYPERFAYMAHISPYDRIYGNDETDIVAQIMKRIHMYDVVQYELRNLRFFMVANHLRSLDSVLHYLLQDGFFLSQIHVLYNPQADVADVLFDTHSHEVEVTWMNQPNRQIVGFQISSPHTSLGMGLKGIIQRMGG
jgi:hypothetical protein